MKSFLKWAAMTIGYMKCFLIAIAVFFMASEAAAQSFTDNLQKKRQNEGNVSVRQSKEIDQLVNGKKNTPKTKAEIKAEKKAAKEAEKRRKEEEKRKKNSMAQQPVQKPVKPVVTAPAMPEMKFVPKIEPSIKHITRTETKVIRKPRLDENGRPVTRKVMKTVVYSGMKKFNGYRVQVSSGGNTREDRQEAERAMHKIKSAFPDQPVYVHFYTPRWACRVGNFEKREDAQELLKEIKKLGFNKASVIESKVAVRNYHVID